MKLFARIGSWWRGEDVDPAALAEAKEIEENILTRRAGDRPGGFTYGSDKELNEGRGSIRPR